ncbi:hypothetical protein DXA38_21420 [[Clostridium] innocuum]|uniref:Uncharacterized protein n=1 Tax=Clostridium innocuum TaxID=1522 RepID=A0A3E2VES7_CLOIN|nr:hypothetical protein DXA38_21420 [[Clostridium] innocuum]RHV57813.1 hypothetical protein DXB22_21485 [Clostridiaceae bacterium OM02-2AC]
MHVKQSRASALALTKEEGTYYIYEELQRSFCGFLIRTMPVRCSDHLIGKVVFSFEVWYLVLGDAS